MGNLPLCGIHFLITRPNQKGPNHKPAVSALSLPAFSSNLLWRYSFKFLISWLVSQSAIQSADVIFFLKTMFEGTLSTAVWSSFEEMLVWLVWRPRCSSHKILMEIKWFIFSVWALNSQLSQHHNFSKGAKATCCGELEPRRISRNKNIWEKNSNTLVTLDSFLPRSGEHITNMRLLFWPLYHIIY